MRALCPLVVVPARRACRTVTTAACLARLVAVVVAAAGLAGCGHGVAATDAPLSPSPSPPSLSSPSPSPPQTPPPAPLAPADGPRADGPGGDGQRGGWACNDALVPPTGYLAETAFVDDTGTDPRQAAADLARQRLLERLCDGRPCEGLAPFARPWKVGSGGSRACAMVVIEESEVVRWRSAQSLRNLDTDLAVAARVLLRELQAPTVAVDRIDDLGMPGGERARWLESRVLAALEQAGGRAVPVPPIFTGAGDAEGIRVLVTGRTVARREQGTSLLELTLQARVAPLAVADRRGPSGPSGTSEQRVAPAVTFTAAAATDGPAPVTPLPAPSGELTLRVTSHHAGGVCAGERAQLYLTSQRAQHVRVIDLYGQGEAVLLFPNAARPDDRVKAGETIALGGPDGFEVVPVPGASAERFLVVAADTPAGLGVFANWRQECRVHPRLATALHRGEGLPRGAQLAWDGYRLLRPDACPAVRPPDGVQMRALQEALLSLPECP